MTAGGIARQYPQPNQFSPFPNLRGSYLRGEGYGSRVSATATVARKRTSLWLDTSEESGFPRLDRPLSVDVAVLGGGIVGVSTALLLKRAGMTVAVVEASRVGAGVTGHTTAKLSSLHGLSYAPDRVELRRRWRAGIRRGQPGRDRADRAVGRGGGDRLRLPAQAELHVCHLARRLGDIEQEVEAAQRAGLPASYTEETDLPYPVAGAIRFDVTGRVPSAPLRARARGARRG